MVLMRRMWHRAPGVCAVRGRGILYILSSSFNDQAVTSVPIRQCVPLMLNTMLNDRPVGTALSLSTCCLHTFKIYVAYPLALPSTLSFSGFSGSALTTVKSHPNRRCYRQTLPVPTYS